MAKELPVPQAPIEEYEWLLGADRPEHLQGEVSLMRPHPTIDVEVMDISAQEKRALNAKRAAANAELAGRLIHKDAGDSIEANHFGVRQKVREKAHEVPVGSDIVLDGIGAEAAIMLARATDKNGELVRQKLGKQPDIIPLATEEAHALATHEVGAQMPGKEHMDNYPISRLVHSAKTKDTGRTGDDPVPTLSGDAVSDLIELKEDEELLPDLDRLDPEVLKFMIECLREYSRSEEDAKERTEAAVALRAVEEREIAHSDVSTAA